MSLIVRPKFAKIDLLPAIEQNKINAYCKFRFEKNDQSSKVHENSGRSPDWSDELAFKTYNPKGTVWVELFHKHPPYDILLGAGSIAIEKLCLQPSTRVIHEITMSSGGRQQIKTGTVTVVFEYVHNDVSIQQQWVQPAKLPFTTVAGTGNQKSEIVSQVEVQTTHNKEQGNKIAISAVGAQLPLTCSVITYEPVATKNQRERSTSKNIPPTIPSTNVMPLSPAILPKIAQIQQQPSSNNIVQKVLAKPSIPVTNPQQVSPNLQVPNQNLNKIVSQQTLPNQQMQPRQMQGPQQVQNPQLLAQQVQQVQQVQQNKNVFYGNQNQVSHQMYQMPQQGNQMMVQQIVQQMAVQPQVQTQQVLNMQMVQPQMAYYGNPQMASQNIANQLIQVPVAYSQQMYAQPYEYPQMQYDYMQTLEYQYQTTGGQYMAQTAQYYQPQPQLEVFQQQVTSPYIAVAPLTGPVTKQSMQQAMKKVMQAQKHNQGIYNQELVQGLGAVLKQQKDNALVEEMTKQYYASIGKK